MTPSAPTSSIRPHLHHLAQAIEAFRALRDDAPLHMMVIFLCIAQRNGVGAGDLARLTGQSQSSISRNIQSLGRGKGGEPGLGLVAQSINPNNSRSYVIRLTSKGAALARELAAIMRGSDNAREATATTVTPEPGQHLHWQNWMD